MKRKSGEVSLEEYVASKSRKLEHEEAASDDEIYVPRSDEISLEDWQNHRTHFHSTGSPVNSQTDLSCSTSNWNRGKKVGKREEEKTSEHAINLDLLRRCCENDCLKTMNKKTIEVTRKWFWRNVTANQGMIIQQHRGSVVRNGKKELCVFDGNMICSEAWRIVHGVSRSRYYEYKGLKKEPVDERDGQRYSSSRLAMASAFFEQMKKVQGDKLPDKEEYLLPSCVDKKGLYEEYSSETNQPFCKRHFDRIWRNEHKDLKLSKGTLFTECKECTLIREARKKNLTKEDRSLLDEQKRAHLLLQRLLREKYYKHIRKSVISPEIYLSIIIDNMDQAKSLLPRFPTFHKGDVHLSRMQHHITGVLCHGEGKSFAFTWTDRFSCDANITINCLLSVLSDILKDKGSLPEVLYLQADNSAKDNKNFILIGFLSSLVMRRIFRKVKLSFLMVGHTHEDVDQMFSRFAVGLQKKAVTTLPVLHDHLKQAYSPEPTIKHLTNIWDYRQLALDGQVQLYGHSVPHVFKMTSKNNRVILSSKSWSLKAEQYTDLDVTDLASSFGNGEPLHAAAATNQKFKDLLAKLGEDIPKWKAAGRLTREDQTWWVEHLQREKMEGTNPEEIPRASALPTFRRQQKDSAIPRDVAESLGRHISSLRKTPSVGIKRRRN